MTCPFLINMLRMGRVIRLHKIQNPSRILFSSHLRVPVIAIRDPLFHKAGIHLNHGVIANSPADIFFIEIVRCKGS